MDVPSSQIDPGPPAKVLVFNPRRRERSRDRSGPEISRRPSGLQDGHSERRVWGRARELRHRLHEGQSRPRDLSGRYRQGRLGSRSAAPGSGDVVERELALEGLASPAPAVPPGSDGVPAPSAIGRRRTDTPPTASRTAKRKSAGSILLHRR
jgi:hypothetical protein